MGQEKGHDDNNKEKMSIRSEGLESVTEMSKPGMSVGANAAKVRKVSAVSNCATCRVAPHMICECDRSLCVVVMR